MLSNWLNTNKQTDIFGYPVIQHATRLLDLLGYISNSSSGSPSSLVQMLGSPLAAVKFNVFRLLAYQRIWNDFYRNSDWQDSDPYSFNVDNLSSGGQVALGTLDHIFAPRYRDWETLNLTEIGRAHV